MKTLEADIYDSKVSETWASVQVAVFHLERLRTAIFEWYCYDSDGGSSPYEVRNESGPTKKRLCWFSLSGLEQVTDQIVEVPERTRGSRLDIPLPAAILQHLQTQANK